MSLATSLPASTSRVNALPLAIALFCLLWSYAFVAGKIGVTHCPPLILLAARFSLAGVLILGATLVRGDDWSLSCRDALIFAVLGIANNALYLGLGYTGLQSVSAGLGGLIAVHFGWRWSLGAMAVLGLLLVAVFKLVVTEARVKRNRVDEAGAAPSWENAEPIRVARAPLSSLFTNSPVVCAYIGSGLQMGTGVRPIEARQAVTTSASAGPYQLCSSAALSAWPFFTTLE